MNTNLVSKVGDVNIDNLIAKLSPAAEAIGVKIAALASGSADATVKRGTVLGRATNGKYSVYGGTGTPAAILADDVTATADGDVTAVAYRCGNFNRNALIVADNYTLTAADEDALRHYNIILTDTM